MGSLLAIDVGKTSIHIVEGSVSKGILTVGRTAGVRVPEGCFNGEVIGDLPALKEALTSAIKTAGFTTKEAVVTFDAFGAVIRDISLPDAKPKEIEGMIRTEMIETYHILPTDVVQYKSIEKTTDDSGRKFTTYRAAALDEDIIRGYHDLLAECRLKPLAMDINVNAISKLFSGDMTVNGKMLNGGSMLIDFGGAMTTVYIASRERPMFFRHLDYGSNDIDKISANETFSSPADIRKMKEEGFDFFRDSEKAQKYFAPLKPFFYNIIDELRKIMGFYTSRAGSGNIDRIFLFGGGSRMTGLCQYLESNFSVPTEQIDSLSNVKFRETSAPVVSCLNAVGALIRSDKGSR